MGVFNDEFEGQGGSYLVGTDGKRVRVPEEGEQAAPKASKARAAPEADKPMNEEH